MLFLLLLLLLILLLLLLLQFLQGQLQIHLCVLVGWVQFQGPLISGDGLFKRLLLKEAIAHVVMGLRLDLFHLGAEHLLEFSQGLVVLAALEEHVSDVEVQFRGVGPVEEGVAVEPQGLIVLAALVVLQSLGALAGYGIAHRRPADDQPNPRDDP